MSSNKKIELAEIAKSICRQLRKISEIFNRLTKLFPIINPSHIVAMPPLPLKMEGLIRVNNLTLIEMSE